MLLKEIEGRIEVAGRQGRRRKQHLDDLKERRGYWNIRSHSVENLLRKRLRTSCKTDNGMNAYITHKCDHRLHNTIWRVVDWTLLAYIIRVFGCDNVMDGFQLFRGTFHLIFSVEGFVEGG